MKHKVLLYIILLSILASIKEAYAQVEITTLKWKSIQKYSFENDSIKYLYFDGANFELENLGLPVFFKREKINFFDADIKVSLLNKVYEEINPSEISQLKDLSNIKDYISIETNVSIQGKQPYSNIKFIPIIKNAITGRYEKLVSFNMKVEILEKNSKTPSIKNQTWADNSVLKEGKWYKIAVNQNGIYKLTYEQLQSMGLNISDPRKIRVYGNGGGMLSEVAGYFRYDDLMENAIYVEGEGDGSFDQGDYVLFYGESPNIWYFDFAGDRLFHHKKNLYADNNYYYINADIGNGKRIINQASSTDASNLTVTDFNDFAFHELDSINFVISGKNWYGEKFEDIMNYNFLFSFPDINPNSIAYLKTNVLARSSMSSSFDFNCCNRTKNINIAGIASGNVYQYAINNMDTMRFIPNNSNLIVGVEYIKPPTNAIGFLDFIEVCVRRYLNFSGNQLSFRDKNSIGIGNVSDFILSNATSNIKVWDVTYPHDAKSQEFIINGNNLSFRLHTDTLHEFIAFNGNNFLIPQLIGNVENQNLHNLSNNNLIIVTSPVFLNEANSLAEFHRNNDNINVVVATTDQIYNEFSSGKQDIAAIRNFAKMFYDRASDPEKLPKNLLLFGDASYDYKNRIPSNTNFVPTYEAESSLNSSSSWVTDDFFGLLDNLEGYNANGDIDIGIGRLPVKTNIEAQNCVDKIKRYASKTNLVTTGNTISNFADWRNTLCFIADDCEGNDGNQFMQDSQQLTAILDNNYKSFTVDKIYLDAYPQTITPGGPRYPDVNQAITKKVRKGALIINYVGHSGETGWSLERILTMTDVNSWNNKYNMPVFLSESCSFSRFDDPAFTSAGESIFLSPNGAGIALYSTTRLAYSGPNFTFAKNFYDTAFTKVNNQYYTMGELIKIAKVQSLSNNNIKNITLLGDPALKLAYPQYNVVTTHLNNDTISMALDTIKALSKVTVNGFIADVTGNKMSDFNGKLYPTIYDKYSLVRTLQNDHPTFQPFLFNVRNNILYKGKVSVKNGEFSFTFMVPKVINYNYGYGKISYYAENGTSDAAGYFENIIIGGSDTTAIIDNQGPDIKLYMNDTNFKSGDITNENPLLLSFLKDDNGVNAIGNGIGRDIVAVLDNDNQNTFILNDYYQSDLDSYKSGSITYPFVNLKEGIHTLKLKAWDVNENSTEAFTEFFVSKSIKMALKNLLNYPNPFSDKTTFYFEHNQSDTEFDVLIQIFSITGSIVKTIKQKVKTDGYIADQIDWNGTDEYGKKIGAGIYIYKIKIGNEQHGYIEESQKLVLIK